MYPVIETLEEGKIVVQRYDWMRFNRILDKSYIGYPLKATHFSSISLEAIISHPIFKAAKRRLHKNTTIRSIVVRGRYPKRSEYFKWLS